MTRKVRHRRRKALARAQERHWAKRRQAHWRRGLRASLVRTRLLGRWSHIDADKIAAFLGAVPAPHPNCRCVPVALP